MLYLIILPIFLLVLTGWIFARFKIFSPELAQQLIQYLLWVAGPAIIILTISNYHLNTIFAWRYWLAYPSVILITGITSFILFYFCFNEKGSVAVLSSFIASIKNVIMIGFPILLSLTSQQAAIPVAITVILFNAVLTPLLLIALEHYSLKENIQFSQKILPSIFINLFKNPFVLSTLIALLIASISIKLPPILRVFLHYISPSFIPCALIAIGIEFNQLTLGHNTKKILALTLLNLIICPTIAIACSYLFHLSPFYSVSLVLLSAMPTAKSMYIYAKKYQCEQHTVAATISMTTIISLLTIPLFVYISHQLWPTAFHFQSLLLTR